MNKNIMVLIGAICVICMSANAWNNFTRRYGPSGHIPAIPLYFKQPETCKAIGCNSCENVEEVRYQCENVEELRCQIEELKQSIQSLETSIAHQFTTKDSVTKEPHQRN